ncbi:MAG: hypothetical protein M1819_003432 [Sarea resinae]|nr:MAG: hypothetical protein M1819_003432 [Sarea resinae]
MSIKTRLKPMPTAELLVKKALCRSGIRHLSTDRASLVLPAIPITQRASIDPQRRDPKHLYRHLLREVSYLPDSASRTYFHEYVRSRFRKTANEPSLPHDHVQGQIQKARKGLSVLKRANAGALKPFTKVLLHTYGRAGKRRQQMLRQLLRPDTPDIPSDEDELKALRQRVANGEDLGLSSKFVAIMRSLHKNPSIQMPRPSIRMTEPRLPELNSWHRPLPQKRKKNLVKAWFATTMDRMMPPLSEEEYNRLRELAYGQRRWEGQPKRRARPRAEVGIAAQDSKFCDRKDGPHNITSRFMRRQWRNIFNMCPLAQWDPAKKKWLIKWGAHDVLEFPADPKMDVASTSLFAGVDENGRSVAKNQVMQKKEVGKNWDAKTTGSVAEKTPV